MTRIDAPSRGHRLAALGLLTLFVVIGYGLVDRVWIARHEYYQSHIEGLQERLQRLRGLLATRQTLESQIRRITQDESIDVFYLQAPSPTLAASQLQQQLKRVVESHGGELISTQILPPVPEEGFSKVAIKVQLTGDTEVFQKVFYTLESNRPLLFIDDLQIRSRIIRRRSPDDRRKIETSVQLTAMFELAGYMQGG